MFMVNAWILRGFFWKLPSWLYYLTPGEMLGALSYMLVHGLIESLLILSLLLVIAALLPAHWLRDIFTVRGAAIVVVCLGSIMIYLSRAGKNLVDNFLLWLIICIALMLVMAFLSTRVRRMTKLFSSLAERFTVFVYIQIPLVIVATIVIVVRNLVQ